MTPNNQRNDIRKKQMIKQKQTLRRRFEMLNCKEALRKKGTTNYNICKRLKAQITGKPINESTNPNKLPNRIKNEIKGKKNRDSLLSKCGESAYLNPQEEKYPVKDPETCKYSCKLIRAAIQRARMNKHAAILKRAETLFSTQNCDNNTKKEN